MVTNLNNVDIYVRRMQKSLMNKMFFVDKIFEPIDNIVDFGCADGALIRAMQYLFPEYNYVGYDISEEMISRARDGVSGCEFYSDWDSVNVNPDMSLLNIGTGGKRLSCALQRG